MNALRHAVFTGEGEIAIADGMLADPGPGEVRLRVGACCLCGSELRQYRQGWPVTPGHEIAGCVDQPGHALHGRNVAVYIPVFCGTCEECREGRTNTCATFTDLIGWQRNGGYAEAMNVPEQCLLPLPDDVPLALAPLLLDTIGTVGHGIRLARRVVTEGPVLILGAGPVGLGAALVARRLGFGPVDMLEPNPARQAFPHEIGARVLAPEALTQRYPLVIEASGKDAARQTALERVAPQGAVVQLGESERWSIEEVKPIRRKDFYLIRSFYFPVGEFAENLDLFRADRAIFERFVDERVGLQGLPGLFRSFAEGRRIKPALSFGL